MMSASLVRGTWKIGVALMLLVPILFPVYWMFVTSLSSDDDLVSSSPTLVPSFDRASAYQQAFAGGTLLHWLSNSLTIALGTALLSVVTAVWAGYALSRLRARGVPQVGTLILISQMIPEALLVVPLYRLFSTAQLLDTLWGLIMVNAALTLPIVTWIVKAAVDQVPKDIEEAARVDGCPPVAAIRFVVLPLIRPTIAAAGVIAFFVGWDEYLFAVTFLLSPEKFPASVGIASLIGQLTTPIDVVMATGVIYALPAMCFFLAVQRHIVAGLTAGSVKG